MKRVFVIVSLMILFEFTCHAQRVYSKQNLEHASLESLNSSLEKAQKLKKTGAILSIAGPVSFVAGALLGAAAWSGGTEGMWQLGAGMIIIGTCTTLIGLPILITGSTRVNKVRKAINTRTGASLNFAPGFVYNNQSQNLSPGIALQIRF